MSFVPVKQLLNESVRLSSIKVESKAQKHMIVMHGLLGSKINWNGVCKRPEIKKYRQSWLVEMRNHATSDHHDEHNYAAMSDDVIRFADQH
jgi:hypothetical protein